MSEGGTRRAVAEVRFGEDRSGIAKVGGRSIHQFWNGLAPYFRDVLLAPQRRSDDGGVSWTWRELPEGRAPSAAELSNIRKRLEKAAYLFAERPVGPAMGEDSSGGMNQPELFDQISLRVKTMIAGIVAKADGDLAGFVCRTETGLMVHSWGMATPAPLSHPDAMESEIQGVVLVGENVSDGHEVVVENAKGLVMARTRSDGQGAFRFRKVRPGRYRIYVMSDRVNFPVKGVTVNVERGAVTRLELRSMSKPGDAGKSSPDNTGTGEQLEDVSVRHGGEGAGSATRDRHKVSKALLVAIVAVLILLLLGGGVWFYNARNADGQKHKAVSAYFGKPPDEPAPLSDGRAAPMHPARTIDDGAGVPASVDGFGKNRPVNRVSRPEVPAIANSGFSNVRGAGGAAVPTSQKSVAGFGSAGGTLQAEDASTDGPDQTASAATNLSAATSAVDLKTRAPSAREARSHVENKRAEGSRLAHGDGKDAQGTSADGQDGGAEGSIATSTSAAMAATSSAPAKTTRAAVARKGSGSPVEAEPVVSIETALPAEIAVSGTVTVAVPRGEGTASGQLAITRPTGSERSDTVKHTAHGPGAADGVGAVNTLPEGLPAIAGDPTTPAPAPLKKASAVQTRSRPVVRGEDNFGANAGENSGDAERDEAEAMPEAAAGAAADSKLPTPKADKAHRPKSPKNDHTTDAATTASSTKNGSANAVPSVAVKASLSVAATARRASAPGAHSNDPSAPAADKVEDKTPAGGHEPGAGASGSSGTSASGAAGSNQFFSANAVAGAEALSGDGTAAMAAADTPSRHTHKISAVRWKARLLRDAILPTRPTLVGEDENVEAMQKQTLHDLMARLPATFAHPVIHYGIVLQVELATGAEPWRWEDGVASGSVVAAIRGNRAELTWPDALPVPPDGTMRLVRPDGSEAARVVFHPDGSRTVDLSAGSRGSYWIGVERAPEDRAFPQSVARFGWQVPEGSAKGCAWRNDDAWLSGRGCRLEISLDGPSLALAAVALVDPVTGWALTSMQE